MREGAFGPLGTPVGRRRFLAWLAGAAVSASVPLRALAAPAPAQLQVICRRAWGAKPPTGDFERHRIRRITVHHSAVVLRDNRLAPERLRDHQAAHQGRGWPDIAYHLLIDRHGNVYEGRPRWAVGDTATNYDPRGHLLVMCEGNFEMQALSSAQAAALVAVLAWGVDRYGVPVRTIRGHRDYADTACPGRRLQRRLGEVRRDVRGFGPVRLDEVCGAEGKALVEAVESGDD